jgi:signal transduction histidine kinase
VGGTGLGLAICRSIVEAHEGVIVARNIYRYAANDAPDSELENGFDGSVSNLQTRTTAGAEFSFSLPAFTEEAPPYDE